MIDSLKIGLIADLHYARRPAEGGLAFDGALAKLRRAIERFNGDKLELMIVMGDLVDCPTDPAHEHECIYEIRTSLDQFAGDVLFLPGNHDLMNFDKHELAGFCRIAGPPLHWSVHHNGWRLIGLDACFNPDGTPYAHGQFHWKQAIVPHEELVWLNLELIDAHQHKEPVVIFTHQALVAPDPSYVIANSEDVRRIIGPHLHVVAVVQAHYHPGDLSFIGYRPYLTLPAAVTSPADHAGCIVQIHPDGLILLDGKPYKPVK